MTVENRFQSDPDELLDEPSGLPEGWTVDVPNGSDPADLATLTALLRAHEEQGRGWPAAGLDDVLVEVSTQGLLTRENVVVRDDAGTIRAWGSVHDRAGGRMLFVHVVERDLPRGVGRTCSDLLVEWAVGQARAVGAARGLDVQQIDTGAFADDDRQQRWLAATGFEKVRTWLQMSRPVLAEEGDLVPDPAGWERGDVRFRVVDADDEADLRAVHAVVEAAFTDHFNHWEETFEEFLHRMAETPGHRLDHWWVAELVGDGDVPQAVGALVVTHSESADGPDGSYVEYIGVLEAARGRGVAKGLLSTVIADAARRGRDRVGLEVDDDSSTGADGLYKSMGWATRYVTQSWHRDVPVAD